MKRPPLGSRIRVAALGSLIIVAGTLLVPTTGNAATRSVSANTSIQVAVSNVPNAPKMPAKGAGRSQWVAWAAKQRAYMPTVNWGQAMSTRSCKVLNWHVFAIAIPRSVANNSGIVVDGVTGKGQCGSENTSNSSRTAHALQPLYTDQCLKFTEVTGAAIVGGWDCLGWYTVGSQAYDGAQYTYEGSSSVTGHEELGSWSTSCSSITTVKNGPTNTLTNGQYSWVQVPVNYSANWSGTWWKGPSGGPYTNEGTVCGTF